ncbi:hypothetical protein ABZU76_33010 [Amycolatopsis sp. NPDC005232]|uniref:hypothetical protein n=1 Tax=Amycolatopsis sp. NPDC005232 TaxID=3157027 RepID=UPI0033B62DA1
MVSQTEEQYGSRTLRGALSPNSIARAERVWSAATVLARLALAAGFLSAVADRFGG